MISAKGLKGSAPSEELAEVELMKKKNDDAMETGPAVNFLIIVLEFLVLTFFGGCVSNCNHY